MAQKILIVDDDPVARHIAHTVLKANGYATTVASDAMGALAETQRQRPDLVILDLGLPAGGGFMYLQRKRSLPRSLSSPSSSSPDKIAPQARHEPSKQEHPRICRSPPTATPSSRRCASSSARNDAALAAINVDVERRDASTTRRRLANRSPNAARRPDTTLSSSRRMTLSAAGQVMRLAPVSQSSTSSAEIPSRWASWSRLRPRRMRRVRMSEAVTPPLMQKARTQQ